MSKASLVRTLLARKTSLVIAGVLIAAGGCITVCSARQASTASSTVPIALPAAVEYVPDSAVPFLPFDDAWPARWNPRANGAKGVIWALDTKVSKLGTRRLRATPLTPTQDERSIFEALTSTLGLEDHHGSSLTLEGRNSIIFVPNAGGRKRDFANNFGFGLGPGTAAGPDAELVFVFASGSEQVVRKDAGEGKAAEKLAAPSIEMQRTWFAYYDAMGDEHSPRDARGRAIARGVVLLMPGMFGTPEVVLDPLTLRLRASGFGVLRMLAQPSRFTERLIVSVDPADLDRSAREVGGIVNERLGECAYAVEAAWAYVHEKREGSRALPHAVVGISGGAISLPPVVARTPSLYSAAVMVGGGAGFWLINERSNYQDMIDAVRTVWVGQAATQGLIGSFDSKLLTHARLDGYHTAGAMKGVKALMLQGSVDRAVPSALGDVLWERLGRPERWIYPANHELLCLGLPAEFDKIVGWLNVAMSLKPATLDAKAEDGLKPEGDSK